MSHAHAPGGSDPRSDALLAILDDVGRVVESARPMPMSASVLVNKAEVLDLVAAAREAVPDQVAAADAIVAQAEGVLAEARAEADRLVAEARAEAARLTSEHEITQAARGSAEEILAAAQAQARDLERDADRYCDSRLAEFEADLAAIQQQAAAGRARLASRLAQR